MILFIDSGNTRLKWRLMRGVECIVGGAADLTAVEPFPALRRHAGVITRVCVSTVGSETSRNSLEAEIGKVTSAPITFYWSEAQRDGLRSSYLDVSKMGADRWHAMVATWSHFRAGCAIVDAGSAVTVDYIDGGGCHIGGFILPGLKMMRRSLKLDAARIGFEADEQLNTRPGNTTGECANHGLAWLTQGIVHQVHRDVEEYGIQHVVVTGGDSKRFMELGLQADYWPELVLDGLHLVAAQGGMI
ncbi:type III pantothenate kinase [Marinobacter sp. JH2]|uniref:type III pantothenate kinase n=1 Tax=Marinobacter sp. AL4B TaxID=2871173 RepID=UPI0010559BC2|nr:MULTISPECIES: type III pantothenate kinase [unclassified Marinobacter]MBZ0332579.1 type III pantothenate kinase [Marinobacter sp. AL4B]QBM18202.1 type III pantothenate kinase [Marinobacter sp. JH2]